MIVRFWMTAPPITTSPDTSVADVALEMARRHIRRLLVVAPHDGRLLGIVSLHDVSRRFPSDVNPLSVGEWSDAPTEPVSQIMTPDPITTDPNASIESVASSLRRHKIGALPVLSGPRVVGLITESDVFRAFVTMTGGDAPGLRVTFDLGEDEDLVPAIAAAASRHGVRIASILSMHHEGRRLASVRLEGAGGDADALVDELWRSGHRVSTVERTVEERP
jgi:acetoin utilization protein AcuB